MTEDRSVLESFLDHIDPGMVNAPGTSVESGLEAALASFPAGTDRHRAVVLLSDGESLDRVSTKSPIRAAEEGIPLYSIGVGGTEGTTIRLPGGGIVTGRNRKPVVTRLNEGPLKTAAELSGGAYFSAAEAGAAGRLAEAVLAFEDSRGKMGFRLVSLRRYRGFLLAGFIALIMHILIRSLGWKKKE
jgi:Ca-activated chloride channel family protein